MKVSVILEHKNNALDKLWSYKVTPNLQSKIKLGQRVKVSFNKQIIIGYIVKIENVYDYDEKLNEIIDVVENKSFVSKRSLNLVKFLEFNFLNRKIDYLNLFVLKFLVANKQVVYYPLVNTILSKSEQSQFSKFGYVLDVKNEKNFKKDFITVEKNFKVDRYIKRSCNIRKFEVFFEKYPNNKQLQYIRELIHDGNEIKILSKFLSSKNLNLLIENEIVKLTKKFSFYDIDLNLNNNETISNHLNFEQTQIVSKINLHKYEQYLLQGVTGSGKTHVFVDLINKVNQSGKIAYVLIPEVGLSYKIYEKLSLYIKNCFLYHYKIPQSYKKNLYEKLQQNKVNLIVGTRSSLFLNNENIGLIIFDEEHDEDYYQNQNPSFDSKTLANVIAKTDSFPILYASATPSIKLKKLEKENKLVRLSLTKSYNKYFNTYEIVEHSLSHSFFSNQLIHAIEQTISKNEQTILLFNKKAYAQYLICNDCNNIEMCPSCSTTLKVYVKDAKLKCLNCGLQKNIPNTCSSCSSSNLNYRGLGIEQVYNELIQIFNPSDVVLIDGDILNVETKRKKIMQQIESNEVKIILGTQIIAKGFDFKNITLGGIIDADNSLNFPQVNAKEVTFQLLNQFIGRIGRHKQGHIILQTMDVKNPLWEQICNSKYDEFALQELYNRKQINAVPFVNECYFKLRHTKVDVLYKQANELRTCFEQLGYQVSELHVPWIGKSGLNYFLEFKVLYTNENTFKKQALYLKQKYNKINLLVGNNPPSWR